MNTQKNVFTFFIIFVMGFSISLGQDIHDAVKNNDLKLLQKILDEDPSLINSPDQDRMTPLYLAVDLNNLGAASLLLEKGADVNASNYKKETPLHIAANKGNCLLYTSPSPRD